MAFVHGKNSFLQIGTANLTGYVESVTLQDKQDVADASTMGITAKVYVVGLADATLAASGFWDATVTTGPDAVFNSLVGSATPTAFTFGPAGSATSSVKYSGSAYLTSYNITAPVGGVVNFAADLQISGPITKGVF